MLPQRKKANSLVVANFFSPLHGLFVGKRGGTGTGIRFS